VKLCVHKDEEFFLFNFRQSLNFYWRVTNLKSVIGMVNEEAKLKKAVNDLYGAESELLGGFASRNRLNENR